MPRRDRLPTPMLGRAQEHGRIRTGIFDPKIGRGGMARAIDTFRLTSPDERAITQLAGIYGGTVKPWHNNRANPPQQFEVITDSTTLSVVLAGQDAVSSDYERWGGGGIDRRCDGVNCTVFKYLKNADPIEEPHPCICDNLPENATKDMFCVLKTRLRVFFPQISFAGVWRYESSSWNVGHEMPAMADLVEQFAARGGLIPCRLRLIKQRKQQGPNVKQYTIVRLELESTAAELVSGEGIFGMRASGELENPDTGAPMLEAGTDLRTMDEFLDDADGINDDGIIDAEIVEDGEVRTFTDKAEAVAYAQEIGGSLKKHGDEWKVGP